MKTEHYERLRETEQAAKLGLRERDATITRLEQEKAALEDWRADATVALRRPGGAFYADVPRLIRELVERAESAEAALVALRQQIADLKREHAELEASLVGATLLPNERPTPPEER